MPGPVSQHRRVRHRGTERLSLPRIGVVMVEHYRCADCTTPLMRDRSGTGRRRQWRVDARPAQATGVDPASERLVQSRHLVTEDSELRFVVWHCGRQRTTVISAEALSALAEIEVRGEGAMREAYAMHKRTIHRLVHEAIDAGCDAEPLRLDVEDVRAASR
jgi:hypothetical protein